MLVKMFLFTALLLSLSVGATAAQEASDFGALMDAAVPNLLAENPGVPGVAIAVIQDGAVVWSDGYGVADRASEELVTADTPFPVASISKIVTAYALLELVAEGQIDLDAPANSYLTRWQIPALGRNNPDEATIRRILSHTAGLSTDGYPGFTADAELPTLEELLDGTGGDPVRLMITPGRRFMYSGGGYTVLQLMIEELTGETFANYMQRVVLEPLGMEHSSFAWTPELGAATQYNRNGDVFSNVVHVDQAAGGMYASANDLAAFFVALLQDERAEAIFTPNPGTESEPYGFGAFIDQTPTGEAKLWHDGLGPGMHAMFYLFPAQNAGVVILTNSPSGSALVDPIMCVFERWSQVDAPEFCE